MLSRAGTALAVLLLAVPLRAQPAAACPEVGDAAELIRCARSRSPAVRRAKEELEAFSARRSSAGQILPDNPVLELQAGRRDSGGGSPSLDRGIALSQAVEVGGQRGLRLDVVGAQEAAARQALEASQRAISLDVLRAVAEVWQGRRQVVVAVAGQELSSRLARVAAAREKEGLGAGLDADLAQAFQLQARREELAARASLQDAELRLAMVVGEDAKLAPEAGLPELVLDASDAATLEAAALTRRADVLAARSERLVAGARLELLRRERVPDLTLGVGLRREESAEILGGSISIPLPLLHRNQGAIGEEQARRSQAGIEEEQAQLRTRLEVRGAHASWSRSRKILEEIPAGLEERLTADLAALGAAYERGTATLPSVLASLRETHAALRTLTAARTEALLSTLELARVAGVTP